MTLSSANIVTRMSSLQILKEEAQVDDKTFMDGPPERTMVSSVSM